MLGVGYLYPWRQLSAPYLLFLLSSLKNTKNKEIKNSLSTVPRHTLRRRHLVSSESHRLGVLQFFLVPIKSTLTITLSGFLI